MNSFSLFKSLFGPRVNLSQMVPVAGFSKYIPNARAKRQPLNTKRAGKGYKKGYGARSEGRITSKGRFIMIRDKVTELVVPDLTNFKLKAYVGFGAKRHVIDTTVNLNV